MPTGPSSAMLQAFQTTKAPSSKNNVEFFTNQQLLPGHLALRPFDSTPNQRAAGATLAPSIAKLQQVGWNSGRPLTYRDAASAAAESRPTDAGAPCAIALISALWQDGAARVESSCQLMRPPSMRKRCT
jgi:hypothetical protein